jgi:hypothetical protein
MFVIFLPNYQWLQPDCLCVSDKSKPQIVVYALAQARAALEAADALDTPITLVSPAGAAAYGGPAWFRELMAQAHDAVPRAAFDSVLDCATEAGLAMAAIREGVGAISFDGPDDVRIKIQDIAAQSGCAIVAIDYETALDLDQCGKALSACRDWLAEKLAE